MSEQFCKFEYRCEHAKMALVYCSFKHCQPVTSCMLYVLMEDRENYLIKQALKKAKQKPEAIKEPLVKG